MPTRVSIFATLYIANRLTALRKGEPIQKSIIVASKKEIVLNKTIGRGKRGNQPMN